MKQHLVNMLKSLAQGNTDEAKDHFAKYSSEKSTEILASGELDSVTPAAPVAAEPVAAEPTPAEPVAAEPTPVEPVPAA